MSESTTKKSAYDHVKAWRARPENAHKRTEEARRYRAKYPEKVRANQRRHIENNRDRVRELNTEAARRRRQDPVANARRSREFKARLLAKREAECGRKRPAVCELCADASHTKIVWDHCHKGNHFRGWICDRCNKVLGLVRDSSELLHKMAAYLLKTGLRTDST